MLYLLQFLSLLSIVLLIGCSGGQLSETDFRWHKQGTHLVSGGYGMSLPYPSPNLAWSGGAGWEDVALFQGRDPDLQLSVFLNAQPVEPNETIAEFAQSVIRAFTDSGSLFDLQQQQITQQGREGWALRFVQRLKEGERQHYRHIGIFPHGERYLVLYTDCPAHWQARSAALMASIIEGVTFTRPPATSQQPARKAVGVDAHQWYLSGSRLRNDGHRLSFDYNIMFWIAPTPRNHQTGGVILQMGSLRGGSAMTIETGICQGDAVADLAERSLKGLRGSHNYDQLRWEPLTLADGTRALSGYFLKKNAPGSATRELYGYCFFCREGSGVTVAYTQDTGSAEPDLTSIAALFGSFRIERDENPAAAMERAFYRGFIAYRDDDQQRAQLDYSTVMALAPESWQAWWGMGHVWFQSKDLKRVQQAFQKVEALNPGFHALFRDAMWEKLGMAYLFQGEYGQAVRYLLLLSSQRPEDMAVFYVLARAHAGNGEEPPTMHALRRVLDLAGRRDTEHGGDGVRRYLQLMDNDPIFSNYRSKPWYVLLHEEYR